MIGRAQRRFVIALGLSLALHAGLMQSHYGKGAARDNISVAAKLLPVATEAKIESPPMLQALAPNPEPDAKPAALPSPAKASDTAAPVVIATPPVTTAATVLAPPADPNYYAVGDLDVFPKALVKPDLSAVLPASQEPAAGSVRATVLIDEAGAVNAVRDVEASTSGIETVTRELLLRTRFTPARNKEGRIVKAQVRVSLDYDMGYAGGAYRAPR